MKHAQRGLSSATHHGRERGRMTDWHYLCTRDHGICATLFLVRTPVCIENPLFLRGACSAISVQLRSVMAEFVRGGETHAEAKTRFDAQSQNLR